jgi:hypothetical protein
VWLYAKFRAWSQKWCVLEKKEETWNSLRHFCSFSGWHIASYSSLWHYIPSQEHFYSWQSKVIRKIIASLKSRWITLTIFERNIFSEKLVRKIFFENHESLDRYRYILQNEWN